MRSPANDNLKKDTPQDVDIAGFPDLGEVVFGHLRRHVNRSATHPEFLSGIQIDSQAPIHHEHFAERTEHYVFRFQVAVDDITRMSERNCITDLHENLDVLHSGLILDCILPWSSVNHLHRIEQRSVIVGTHVVDWDDIRMI